MTTMFASLLGTLAGILHEAAGGPTRFQVREAYEGPAGGGGIAIASEMDLDPTQSLCAVVTASAGNVGPTGYATVKTAFDAINAGTHQGAISISVNCDTVEAASAVLNASGTGSAFYSSVLITPSGVVTVSSTLAAPLIDLNGADNVTIDGLNSGGNSLALSNASTAATSETSTLRLVNGAQNNTITNCNIRGSSIGFNDTVTGNVLISTSTGGANRGNTISNNNIGPAGANLPSKCVMSLGSARPNDNVGNMIDNNNIFDFFNPGASCNGIRIRNNSDLTTISNNRIYQTAPRAFTAGSALRYSGICVITSNSSSSSDSATISGNRIGFGAPDGTGTTTISGLANSVNGIEVPIVSTGVATSIQDNTISGFNQTTSLGAVFLSNSAFIGISVGNTDGLFNIGGVTGNTIGSLDGSSSIVCNNTTTTSRSWAFVGILHSSPQTADVINNNNIGTITINSGGTGTGAGFRGISVHGAYGMGQSVTINNNIIGGTAAGSITDNVVGDYDMFGIDNFYPNLNCVGNLIRNISGNASTTGGINSTISGIIITGLPTGVSTISQNMIHSLTDNATPNLGVVIGLYCNFPSTANLVEGNMIHSLNVISNNLARNVIGLYALGGSGTYTNNMVRLGLDSNGSSITDGYPIYGIKDTTGANNYYFNSVHIGGTGVTSSQSTFAFRSYPTNNTRNFLDNIFDNSRNNASGNGRNYAIVFAGSTPNPAGLTSNYNILYAPGTGGQIGMFNNVDQPTLLAWQTATGQDATSVSSDPQFLDPNGTARPAANSDGPDGVDVLNGVVNLHISGTSPCIGAGTPVAGVYADFDNEFRSPSTPDVGADEQSPYTGPTPTASPTPTPSPSPTASPTPTPTPSPIPSPTLPPDGLTISGRVVNCSSPAPTATPPATPTPPTLPPVPNVLMTVTGSASGTRVTDGSGNYSLTVAPGGSYTVTPSKAPLAPASGSINTTDVLAIQRHFLGISIIPAGCRLTAADAAINGTINTQDVIAVQRFFLGFTVGTGSCGLYKFVPANRSYPSISTNQTGQDYAMYVVGDVAAAFGNRPQGQ